MRLLGIYLRNFGPFRGEHTIDLSDVDILAVTGPNGSGKSMAFLDAPHVALFGYGRSGKSLDAYVTEGESDMEVAVWLDGMEARRGWDGAGWLEVSGMKKGASIAAKQKEILRLIAESREDYEATRCFTQNDNRKLAESKPTALKKLVEGWVCRPVWAQLHGYADTFLKQAEQDISDAQRGLEELGREWQPEPPERPLGELSAEVEAWAEKAEDLRRQQKEASEAKPEPSEELLTARAEAESARRDLTAARGAQLDFDGQCPVLDKACPVADTIRDDQEALDQKAEKARDAYRGRREAAQALEDELEADRTMWRDRLASLSGQIRDADAEISTRRYDIAQADHNAGHLERLAKRKATEEAELADATERRGVWSYIHRMLGPDGIPGQELAAAVESAEAVSDAILESIEVSYRTYFQHGRELRSRWADYCLACGSSDRKARVCQACGAEWIRARSQDLGLRIKDDVRGVDLPWSQESGGRRDGASMALRLAFARQTGNLRFALCDEVFKSIDVETRPRVAAFLCSERFKALGFDQVIVLSHDRGLVASAPHRIHVEWTPEGSRFQWV